MTTTTAYAMMSDALPPTITRVLRKMPWEWNDCGYDESVNWWQAQGLSGARRGAAAGPTPR